MVEKIEKSSRAEPAEPQSFEQILEQLDAVVRDLEGGELPLERSVALFEEGVRLRRLAEQRLDEAERRVEILLEGDASGATRPLDDANDR